jgi:hypothetical protein
VSEIPGSESGGGGPRPISNQPALSSSRTDSTPSARSIPPPISRGSGGLDFVETGDGSVLVHRVRCDFERQLLFP